MKKKLLWSVAAIAVVGGFVVGMPNLGLLDDDGDKDGKADAADMATTAAGLDQVKVPPVEWGKCPAAPDGFQVDPGQTCGTVSVPLDYRHPEGRKIEIAVSRIAATDKAKRRGVLLLNPGGPGNEGLNQPSLFDQTASKAEKAAYDRIGFDPRGVGHSTPVTCGLDPDETMPPYPYPDKDGSIDKNVAHAKDAAQRCAKNSGDLLPYITTANTARDMDLVRRALGEEKISYWGNSYGTYLGAAYATLFPGHTDRMTLDSAVDPEKIWYGVFSQQSKGVAVRFPDVAAYAAQHQDEVGFGATPEAVTTAYTELLGRLDDKALTVPGAAVKLDGNILRYLTSSLLTADQQFPMLTQVWRATADLADGKATDEETAALQQILVLASPSANTSPGVPEDNAIAAAYAVACDDVSWPKDVKVYERNVARDRAQYPLTAGSQADIWPCAFWADKPVEKPVEITDKGRHNILILQNERDPNATLDSGKGMHKALGKRSTMVTVEAGGHGVYGNPGAGECASKLADAYMVDGKLPAHDTHCAAPAE
ncbi:alpha/beta hydrolase [Streptomyces sp. NPDC050560]|uniref:alpha/beta hydrolase n=1 Tax=Streptomyces sp. NPDC050560 TaxID=3365630 RepID=UPI00378DDD72